MSQESELFPGGLKLLLRISDNNQFQIICTEKPTKPRISFFRSMCRYCELGLPGSDLPIFCHSLLAKPGHFLARITDEEDRSFGTVSAELKKRNPRCQRYITNNQEKFIKI